MCTFWDPDWRGIDSQGHDHCIWESKWKHVTFFHTSFNQASHITNPNGNFLRGVWRIYRLQINKYISERNSWFYDYGVWGLASPKIHRVSRQLEIRRADAMVPVWRLEMVPEEAMFQFESKGKKEKKKSQRPHLRGIRQEEFSLTQGAAAFLFYSGLK